MVKTNNEIATRLADILARAGCKIKAITVLGIFVHVDCWSEAGAQAVNHVLAQSGMYRFLKLTHSHERAKHQNPKHNACGFRTWVDTYTLHAKVVS